MEHVAVPLDYESSYPYSDNGRMPAERAIPMAEPLVWAAHLAAVTTTLKLASGVLVLPQREPVLLAKQAATIAVLSEGRLILGAGTGWLREEFAILGAEFDHRVARMDEHVTTMRALWADDVADFDGTFVSFTGSADLAPTSRRRRADRRQAATATLPPAGRDGSATAGSPPRRPPRRCRACSISPTRPPPTRDATPAALKVTDPRPVPVGRRRGSRTSSPPGGRSASTASCSAPTVGSAAQLGDNVARLGEEVIDHVRD